MPTASRADGSAPGVSLPASDAPVRTPGQAASWRTPAGLVIVAATMVGLVLRLVLLLRPGFLTSGTIEYDDGVYLGAAIRLLEGALPYKDYAYVQPPGILAVSLPFALVAKGMTTAAGLASARIATTIASAACIPLAGRLVRHKGAWVALVTCGFLAVYPADVLTARTLLLEPWMNFFCLIAVCLAFSRGRLASPRRLIWAGVVLGFAVTIKFWAGAPAAVLLVVLLISAHPARWRRVRGYLAGLIAGFAVPVIAFAAAAPGTFVHSAILDQATRMGAFTPMRVRMAYLTGMIPLISGHGGVTAAGGSQSALALGSNGTMVIKGMSSVPLALAALGCLILAVAYFRRPRSRSPLEWFGLGTAVIAVGAVSLYSAFFYHYPAFPAPWLAIALGAAAGALAGAVSRAGAARVATRAVMACAAVALLAGAVLEGSQLATQKAPPTPYAADRLIPPGACVVSDQVAYTLAADRFTASQPGCPDILDSMASTLTLSGGVSVPAGAGNDPKVIRSWEGVFSRAQYVWLSQGFRARIPWTAELQQWFDAHFRQIATYRPYGHSILYQRR